MKKELTEQEALLRLQALCATAEHCRQEMREKLMRWGIGETAREHILDRLAEERYVDDERYARAFVADKIEYNKWGRMKIEQALYQKGIGSDIRQRVLGEIDDETYLETLRPLLKNKSRSIKAASLYERNGKLMRFAMSRGFDMNLIRQCIDGSDED